MLPLYAQLTLQPLTALLPVLVIRIAPVKPEPQLLVTTYVHLLVVATLELRDERLLELREELDTELGLDELITDELERFEEDDEDWLDTGIVADLNAAISFLTLFRAKAA